MSELIESVERRQMRRASAFRVGDRVRVHFQVVEGTRRRTQVFEGVVLKQQGAGARRTFTVRKLSFGVGVERTFPLHSPKIERIEVVARGEVRRAKLYYLRGRIGRRARVRESRDFRPEDVMWPFDAETAAGRQTPRPPRRRRRKRPQAAGRERPRQQPEAARRPPEAAEARGGSRGGGGAGGQQRPRRGRSGRGRRRLRRRPTLEPPRRGDEPEAERLSQRPKPPPTTDAAETDEAG